MMKPWMRCIYTPDIEAHSERDAAERFAQIKSKKERQGRAP